MEAPTDRGADQAVSTTATMPAGEPVAMAGAAASPGVPESIIRARPLPVEPIEPRRGPSETEAIYSIIGRYQSAFNELNASVAKAVWPSVDRKALGRAFDELETQELVFDGCQVEVADPRATASCRGRARYVPKVGSKNVRLEPRRWTFKLLNTSSGWIIDSVQSR